MVSSGSMNGNVKSRKSVEAKNETQQVNLFTTTQNMDTPLITEREKDTAAINSGDY